MYTSSAIRIFWRCTRPSRAFRSELSAVQSWSGGSRRVNIPRLITTHPCIVSRWLTFANSASNLVEPHSVTTFASPSADCSACWSSMRSMIADRQDETGAGLRHPLGRRAATAHSRRRLEGPSRRGSAGEERGDRAEEHQYGKGEQVITQRVRRVFVEVQRAHHAQASGTRR